MKAEHIVLTPHAPAPVGPYSQAVQIGNELYCSGQIPLDPQSGELVGGDITAQTERVLQNLGAVLCAAGCHFGRRRQDDGLSGRHERFRRDERGLRPLLWRD